MQLEIIKQKTNSEFKITFSDNTGITVKGEIEERDIEESILFLKNQLSTLQGFRAGFICKGKMTNS